MAFLTFLGEGIPWSGAMVGTGGSSREAGDGGGPLTAVDFEGRV